MKNDYAWRITTLLVVVLLMAAAVLTSCGNGGGIADLGNTQTSVTNDVERGTGVLTITEDEVGSLPAWQQTLLNDPGWNQPAIPQRADTPMPAPSHEMLMQWQEEAFANGISSSARPELLSSGKGSSWIGGTPTTGQINRGEYNIVYSPSGTVPYGCKDSGGTNGHMKEKNLALQPIPVEANQAITFVERGASASNHFNTTGGASNNALAAVYQIWSSQRAANPSLPYSNYNPPSSAPAFAELSYRADGGPAAGGNPCSGSAFTVREFMWWKYNQQNFNSLPGLTQTALYNILIAPSSNVSTIGVSGGGTSGRWQGFYMGNLSSVFGGGQIVSLESSTSTCATFSNSIAGNRLFYTNPIYGVLLQRWQDSVLESMNPPNNVPWKGEFGWPVQGPTAYNGGASTLTGNGAYYAWGMYFEKGFFWWIDYINNANVPDEAQAYLFSGANVFCKGTTDKYERLPTVFYGGSGPLGVSVVIEASLNPDRGPGSPPAGTFYEVANPVSPLLLDMHAHAYGGTPRASDGRYRFYTWAFRDGTLGVTNGTAFDDVTKYVQHAYAEQAIYTVRVQVVDNNNVVGYGDSLPIHVGSGGGGSGAGQIWLIRMDGGTYNNNYNALKTSLTNIGVSVNEQTLSATTAADYLADATSKVAILYRGGPGGSETNNNTTAIPANAYTQMTNILTNGSKKKLLFVSQSHGTTTSLTFPFGDPALFADRYGGSVQAVTADYTQLGPLEGGNSASSNYQYDGQPSVGYVAGWHQPQSFDCNQTINVGWGTMSSSAAERYAGAGASSKIPVNLQISGGQQITSRCRPGLSTVGWNPNFQSGCVTTIPTSAANSYYMLSYGSNAAPGMTTAGTGKYWCIGYSWADMTVTSPSTMNKDELLRNILAYLDSSLTFTAKTNGGFQEYSGPPQIVSVTPAFWDEVNYMYRTGGQTAPWNGVGGTGGRFPDQTSPNAYRSTAGSPPNAIVTTDINNNWINGNDVDFQHTFYAYIDRGGNATMELGGTGPSFNATDDSVFYAGLLLSDLDLSWQRVSPNIVEGPTTSPSIMLKEQANSTFGRNPMPLVAGYYQSTGAGSTADDQYSNYGTENDAFTAASLTWDNNNPLHVETVARWPVGTKYFNWTGPGGLSPNAPDAYLVWQVYPGQGNMIVTGPRAGQFIGINAPWEEYLRSFDIDPSFAVSGRANTGWNKPSFTFKDDPSKGRVVNFNFRKVPTWNPDLNRDGALTNADKFPVRCRFFVQHQTYYNKVVAAGAAGWPNHLPDFGGDPAITPPATQNPTVIEAGTYVRDSGSAVYPLQVTDDPAANDPHLTVLGAPGTYTVAMNFIIRYGSPNYLIEADTYYSGSFAPGPNGSNGQPVPLVTVKPYGTAPNTNGIKSYVVNVPANQANGPYSMAVRVTDNGGSVGSVVATFVWPTLVTLAPSNFIMVVDDTLDNGYGNRSRDALVADLQFLYGAGSVQTHTAPAAGTAFSGATLTALQGATAMFWPSDAPFTDAGYTGPTNGNFSFAASNSDPKVAQINAEVSAGLDTHYIGGGSFRLQQQAVWTASPAYLPWANTSFWYFDGDHGPSTFFGALSTTPNNLAGGGYDTLAAGALGSVWREQNVSTGAGATAFMMGYINSTSYPAGAYLPFGSGRVTQMLINYGDLNTTQNATANKRRLYLENILCKGSAASPWNSPNT